MAIVYQHIRLDTEEVFYVGIGKSKNRPASKHGRNDHWWNIVNKVGYRIEIIYYNIPYDLALNMEKYLIELYGRTDLGNGTLVNKNTGGGGVLGYKPSPEVIEKRVSQFRGKKRPRELVERIRLLNKGKKRTYETREKNRLANLGKVLSKEHRNNISKGLLISGRKGKGITGKKVINTETGEIYKSAMEVSRLLCIPKETFRHRMINNKINYKYLN